MKRLMAGIARKGERGSELVEFAVGVTTLLTISFGVMGFARGLYVYHGLCNAAREGTRYAIVRGSACTSWSSACPATATDVQNYVLNVPLGMNPAAMTVTPSWSPNNNPGSTVQVQVQYSFQFFYPFLPAPTYNLTTSSKMVISQ